MNENLSIKHCVVKGDTLWGVSIKYKVTIDQLKEVNDLSSDVIQIDQLLLIPPPNLKPSVLIKNGGRVSKRIALTYDAGSMEGGTRNILQVLKKHQIQCTFFLTGQWAEKFSDLAILISTEGHEIGNHSYSHPDFRTIKESEMRKELEKGEQIILDLTGKSTKPIFRPPFGAWNVKILQAVGNAGFPYSIYWSIDTIDWKHPPTDTMVKRIMVSPSNGDIILMHVGGTNTPEASDIVIGKLKKAGFELVTVSQLLNINH